MKKDKSIQQIRKGLKFLLIFVVFFLMGMFIRDLFLGGEGKPLHFYCGAGLRPAVSEIVENFEEETGIAVRINYGASNILLGQLQANPEGDLFMPGDEAYVQKAKERTFIEKSVNVARFVPVIMVQDGNPHQIESLHDLADPAIKLGVGDERAAAIGGITWQIFEKNNLSREEMEENVVFDGTTVHDLATGVIMGHIDAAIVWETVARRHEEGEVIPIPPDDNVMPMVPLAILSFSENNQEAQKFMDFMLTQESREIFDKHHFGEVNK